MSFCEPVGAGPYLLRVGMALSPRGMGPDRGSLLSLLGKIDEISTTNIPGKGGQRGGIRSEPLGQSLGAGRMPSRPHTGAGRF